MLRYKIVFMGSPDFAIPALRKLANKHELCAVYTQPAKPAGRGMKPTTVPVAVYAEDKKMPLYSPQSLSNHNVQLQLAAHKADLFIVVAYGLLLPKAVLNMPAFGCINGHASLLPRWRGAAPIHRAIAAGDSKTGVSAMLMDEGLDTGMVLTQRTCTIDYNETAGSLHDKLAKLNATLLDDTIMNITRLLTAAKPQDKSQAKYANKISSQDAEIDWSRNSSELDCHIRAFSPSPGAWCFGPKGRLRILRARPVQEDISQAVPAGNIIKAHRNALHVATGDGALALEQVQPAGKKPMTAAEFLNGQKLENGQQLAVRTK